MTVTESETEAKQQAFCVKVEGSLNLRQLVTPDDHTSFSVVAALVYCTFLSHWSSVIAASMFVSDTARTAQQ